MKIINFIKLFCSITNRDYETGKFYFFNPKGEYNSYPYFPVIWVSPLAAARIAYNVCLRS